VIKCYEQSSFIRNINQLESNYEFILNYLVEMMKAIKLLFILCLLVLTACTVNITTQSKDVPVYSSDNIIETYSSKEKFEIDIVLSNF